MACDTLIVGAGIAGLYCARELLKHNPNKSVLICEKYKELGGRIATFRKGDISWEIGAGRISDDHKMIHRLLKEYGLHTISIGSDLKYKENGKAQYEDNHFEPAIDIFLGPLRMLPATILGTKTLQEAMIGVYGEKETQRWMDRFPYHAEVTIMRADMALREFFGEMYSHGGYGVCKEGLSALTDAMAADIRKRGGHFRTEWELISLVRGCAEFRVEGEMRSISAKKIILTLPVNALGKLALFKRWKPLTYVEMSPLLRIYAQFKSKKAWFHGLPSIVTTSPIRYFIPVNEGNGSAMISYTDNHFATHYMKIGDKQKTVMKDLRELFPDRDIPEPDEFHVFPWSDGVSYWVPGNYEPSTISREALHPFPGIYICGETFSLRQGWVEGALEHAAELLDKHF